MTVRQLVAHVRRAGWRYPGWRGAALLFLAVMSFGLAIAYLPSSLPVKLPGGLQLLIEGFPWAAQLTIVGYVSLWMAAGVSLTLGAFLHRDMWAIAIVIGALTLAGAAFLAAWVINFPSRDYLGAVVYIGFAGFLFAITRPPRELLEEDG